MLGSSLGIADLGLPPPTLAHQREVVRSRAKATLAVGAYGSGKTLTNAWVALTQLVQHPGTLGLIGAETEDQLRETLQGDFDTLTAPLMEAGALKYNGERRLYTLTTTAGTSWLLARPLVGSNAQAMRHRIRSLNLGFAVIEEGTAIPRETTLEVLGRLRRLGSSRQLWISCNPDSPGHYLYEWFIRKPRRGFRCVTSNAYANPFLPADYLRTLEDALTPEMASRYLRGEWVNFEGLVYKEFRRELHVIEALPPGVTIVRRWAALDFGGANPHALLWLAEDAQGFRYVTNEWYASQVALKRVADAIQSDAVSPIFCDHDVADRLTLEDEYRVRGLIPARKEKMPGIDTVSRHWRPAAPGSPPRLRVLARCENLIREIEGYAWPSGTTAKDPNNEPVKRNDHAVDALRYGLHSLEGPRARLLEATAF